MTPEEYEEYEDEQAALLGVFGPEAQAQAQAQVKARREASEVGNLVPPNGDAVRRAGDLVPPVGDLVSNGYQSPSSVKARRRFWRAS